MISRASTVRLTRWQLGLVAAVSTAATVLVIASALGRTAAQSAAQAALHHPPVEVRLDPPASSPPAAPVPIAPAAAPVPGPSTAPADASAAASAPVTSVPSNTTTGATSTTTSTTSTAPARPKAKHVFLVVLSTSSFDAAFGPSSTAHYLNQVLRPRGTLLGGYQTLGQSELPDYLAMISGQPPNADTQSDCPSFAEFPSASHPASSGVLSGDGCVYPNTVLTVADQVTGAGGSWRAYVDGIGSSACPHPNSGASDLAPITGAGSAYAYWHNPFVFFHSLLDLGGCASGDVSLTQLPGDLRSAHRTPRLAFIAPGACVDSAAASCSGGGLAGLAAEDAFLRQWVPKILKSSAYRHGGVLIVAFAHSAPAGPESSRGSDGPVPTGTLILSPRTRHGRVISATYDPYSLLRTVEDLLGYKPLARARTAKSFAAAVVGGG